MSLALATNPTDNPGVARHELLTHLRETALSEPVKVGQDETAYTVVVNHPAVAKKIQASYDAAQLEMWKQWLATPLRISVTDRGVVPAAERVTESEKDPTNYDAIWVRDSLWAYLALASSVETENDAIRVITTLWDYFASPRQLERRRLVTARPSLLQGTKGAMNVPHIRFDGNSKRFGDVQVGKSDQPWNHKQNDALGLWLDLTVRAVTETGRFDKKTWTPARLEALARLPTYFKAVKYFEMEDAGSWEEIERTNSSSMGLVISGLERLQILAKDKAPETQAFYKALKKRGLLSEKEIDKLVDQGYERLFKQLDAGGESPLYAVDSPRYRKSDAALLNLIYPARLSRLTSDRQEQVLKLVRPLVGEVGIKRYIGDSYQSGNFWFPEEKQTLAEKTDDSSSASKFAARGKQFLEGTEAQWFFDSWMSIALGSVYETTKKSEYRRSQIEFLNRALGQLTGESRLGADGRPVPGLALPESYNTVVDKGDRFFAPSPITPLNWAKATLRLALKTAATGT